MIPAGKKDYLCKIIRLGPADQDNLVNSDDIRLYFTMFSPTPGAPVSYGSARGTTFTIKIAFHAPVQLWKL